MGQISRTTVVLGVAAVLASSCVDEPLDHHQRTPMEDEDVRTVRKGIALSELDNGCSTAGTQGLSNQLLGEMACLSDGALVEVSHPNVRPTSNRVHLYMSPQGRTMLRRAADRATIEVNSALRTINEQYVLWRGCPVAADPGTSNHETGKAIDVDNYPQVDGILKQEGFARPLPSSDPVHYVAPGRDLRDISVLAFQKLWNANHPGDQIAEDGAPGPQTYSRLGRAPAGGFRTGSACRGGGDDERYDGSMTVRVNGGGANVETGGSDEIRDYFPGETFNAVIRLKNKSEVAWEDPRIGYRIEEPYLEAVGYRIEDDHPAHDQQSWSRNDANDRPENPAQSELGERGEIYLNGMSPGESKRVVLEMEATRYSFGAIHHPDVRGWLWHIGGVYGEQKTYHQEPSNANKIGHRVRDYRQTDVFDRDQWRFRGRNEADFEGWTARGPHDEYEVNTNHDALALHVTGADGGVVSPTWTEIDAERFDELVLRMRSHEGEQVVEVFFAGADEEFAEDRVVRFRAPGDGEFHRLVVPIGEHPEWEGETVRRIRVDPFGERRPSRGSGWWFDLAAVYAQDSDHETTSSRGLDYADGERVTLIDDSETGGGDGNDSGEEVVAEGPDPVMGGETGPPPSESDESGGGGSQTPPTQSKSVRTSSSCSTSGGGPLPVSLALFGFLLLAIRRRE